MNNHTSLVLQSFGRENEYKRALLTIFSYYAYTSVSISKTKVILFTDQPEYFGPYLGNLPVEYVLLTPEKIKNMRGSIDFLHRMKIALIEETFGMINGPMLYADSDTFFIADPKPLLEKVSSRKAFMHLQEYAFVQDVEDRTETYKKFYRLINRNNFKFADGSMLKVTPQHSSWNAGVMIFHPSHAQYMPDVYSLTDQFYPNSGSHASEQYAFSLVLQEHVELQPCDHVVYHYWYRIKKQIADEFLNKQFNDSWFKHSLNDKLKQVKAWTLILPRLFEKHIWMTRDHAIQAFNENKFSLGYRWTLKAMFQKPLGNSGFLKDTFYHLKRHINLKYK